VSWTVINALLMMPIILLAGGRVQIVQNSAYGHFLELEHKTAWQEVKQAVEGLWLDEVAPTSRRDWRLVG